MLGMFAYILQSIVLLLVLSCSSISLLAGKNFIFVYEDEGASPQSVQNTKHSLRAVLDESYEVKGIKAEDVRQGIDLNTVALLVMPGGRATPYRQKLYEEDGGSGNKAIKKFIEEGGNYLGLGAGGYYAGNRVLFDQENLDERQRIDVSEEKLLSFFPGTVIGPAFIPFMYQSHEGAKAIKLRFENGICEDTLSKDLNKGFIYYNGGGFFDPSVVSSCVQVIARYETEDHQYPAIVECTTGKGKAILSGVHPEYTLEVLDQTSPDDQFIQNLKPLLSDEYSYSVFKYLLGRLQIKVK
jgi:biotin---protein ligase